MTRFWITVYGKDDEWVITCIWFLLLKIYNGVLRGHSHLSGFNEASSCIGEYSKELKVYLIRCNQPENWGPQQFVSIWELNDANKYMSLESDPSWINPQMRLHQLVRPECSSWGHDKHLNKPYPKSAASKEASRIICMCCFDLLQVN